MWRGAKPCQLSQGTARTHTLQHPGPSCGWKERGLGGWRVACFGGRHGRRGWVVLHGTRVASSCLWPSPLPMRAALQFLAWVWPPPSQCHLWQSVPVTWRLLNFSLQYQTPQIQELLITVFGACAFFISCGFLSLAPAPQPTEMASSSSGRCRSFNNSFLCCAKSQTRVALLCLFPQLIWSPLISSSLITAFPSFGYAAPLLQTLVMLRVFINLNAASNLKPRCRWVSLACWGWSARGISNCFAFLKPYLA